MNQINRHHPSRTAAALRVAGLSMLLLVLLSFTVLPVGAASSEQEGTHTVQRGETLSIISRATGTSVSELIRLNGPTYPSLYSNPNLIYPGWVLKLAAGATTSSSTSGGSTTTTGGTSGGTYTIQRGDYLAKIARTTGTTVSELINLNASKYPGLRTNPNVVYVGWVLTLPGGATTPTQPTDTTADTSGQTSPPPDTGGFALGGQTHSLAHPGEMRYAGMTWVKFQHKWTPGEDPSVLAGRIDSAHSQGFKVLLSVTGPDHPSAIDYGAYANFVGGLAGLGADGIEIWNEMNFDREWPAGQISGANYVNNMLRPAYNAIKGANGSTLVVTGAPTPTGAFPYCGANIGSAVGCNDDTYLRQMAAAGAASVSDCVGMHYNAGTTSPYATSGANVGSYHYSWYYTPMVNVYYGAFGGSSKLCITELGYLVGEGANLPASFSWASTTSLSEHARWLAENVQIARDSGKVRLLIVWNVDIGETGGGDPQGGYSIIRGDGSCPACDSMRGVTGGA